MTIFTLQNYQYFKPGIEGFEADFLGGGGELLFAAAAILLFSFFFLRDADLSDVSDICGDISDKLKMETGFSFFKNHTRFDYMIKLSL